MRDTPEGEKIITTLEDIFVEKMDDSGMGSLQVILEGADHRRFDGVLADIDAKDADCMYLLISVILDTDDNFYELDILKENFSLLIKLPEVPPV